MQNLALNFEPILIENDATRIAYAMKHVNCPFCHTLVWYCRCELRGQPDCRMSTYVKGLETYDWVDFNCSKCNHVLCDCPCDSPTAVFITKNRPPSINNSKYICIHRVQDLQVVQSLHQKLSQTGGAVTLSMCPRSDRQGLLEKYVRKGYLVKNSPIEIEQNTCQCRFTNCSGNSLLVQYQKGPSFPEWNIDESNKMIPGNNNTTSTLETNLNKKTKEKKQRKKNTSMEKKKSETTSSRSSSNRHEQVKKR